MRVDRAQDYADAFLATEGVVGLWPLWEMDGMGSAYRDLGPSRMHGTRVGGMTPCGLSGAAADRGLLGNGSSGYVEVPHAAPFNLGEVLSISAIVHPGATGAIRAIASKGQFANGSTGGYYIRLSGAGNLTLVASWKGELVQSTIPLAPNEAHHCVATRNGGTAVKLYIDGLDVTGAVTNWAWLDTDKPFRIGADTNGLGAIGEYTNARLAMVGLHRRAITAGEAAYLSAVAFGG